MIHRFVDLPAVVSLEPNLVFLTSEASPSSKFVLWTAGNLATPNRLDSTQISSTTSVQYLADSELSPDGDQALYVIVTQLLGAPNTKTSEIRKVAFDDSTNVSLYTDTGAMDGVGNVYSLQPTWHPDGTEILFRSKGAGATTDVLKVMAPDGTGVTTIYTSSGGAFVQQPLYNYDGTLIAWLEGTQNIGFARLVVANADGSGATTVHSETSPASIAEFGWGTESNVLFFTRRDSSAFSTTDWSWKVVNSDGTGLTTMLSIDRSSGYGPSDTDPSAFKWTALPGDSAVVTTIQTDPSVDDEHFLTSIPADGSARTDYSPTQIVPVGSPDFRPAYFGGARIYFADANPATRLSSIKLDGSDYRNDFVGAGVGPDGASVVFHGFKGDTLGL